MKIGLVLSGGGARGLSHVGVLLALEELKIPINAISGTSAGALVGTMFACGISPSEIADKVIKQSFLGISNLNFNGVGFFSHQALTKFIQSHVSCKYFEDLNIKMFVTATNIEAGNYEVFSSGDIFQPVTASAAVPLMFDPVIINGKRYLDGGIMNNFPVEPLLKICDTIIGSNVSTWPVTDTKWTKTLIAQRSFQLAISTDIESKKSKCKVIIDPPIGHFKAFSKSKINELVEIGYNATMAQKDELNSLL